MKFMLTPLLICGLLQVVWVSILTDVVTAADSCEDHNDNQTACCDTGTCAYYNCTTNNETLANSTSACTSLSDTKGLCPDNFTISSNLCGGQTTAVPTTPVSDACTQYTVEKDCCDAACSFYNCTSKTVNSSVCTNETDTKKICQEPSTISPDICVPAPITTPSAPFPDNCTKFSESVQKCCGTPNCAFFNCTNPTTEKNISVCDNNQRRIVCPENYTLSYDQCQPPPVTTPSPSTGNPTETPTQSPSTGERSGQHFDGASFIGGIVLCLGLVAIGFFGTKFYRSRQDANYHTL